MPKVYPILIVISFCVGLSAGGGYDLQPHKRQTQGDQCNGVAVAEQCVNGYNQDYAELAFLCNQTELATALQSGCIRNSMGQFCGTFDTFSLSSNIESTCGITDCLTECRELLTNTRNELGCCINVLNDTNSGLFDPSLTFLMYSLLDRCDVQPLTDVCEPSMIDLPDSVDPSCTESVLLQRLYTNVLCNRQYLESIQLALSAVEGCRDDMYTENNINSLCTVNEFGRYCDSIVDLRSNVDFARENCVDTDDCDQTCIGTLVRIMNTAGCCLNNLNNSVSGDTDFLSYQFWSQCGLDVPGFCGTRVTDGDVTTTMAQTTGTTQTTSTESGFAVAPCVFILAILCVLSLIVLSF